MRVLLVEDDRALAQQVADFLRAEHFAIDIAANGEDGRHLGLTEAYDAAILDLGLPKMDGAQVLRAWRAAGRTLPVLILTAREGWSEKVDGFKAGADDYLTKPFRIEEVVMRLRALVRRAAGLGGPGRSEEPDTHGGRHDQADQKEDLAGLAGGGGLGGGLRSVVRHGAHNLVNVIHDQYVTGHGHEQHGQVGDGVTEDPHGLAPGGPVAAGQVPQPGGHEQEPGAEHGG